MKVSSILSIITALAVISGPACYSQDKKVKRRTVKTVEGLRFSPVRMRMKTGETMEFKIENHDPNDQPHNFVIIKPGTLKEIQTASMAVGPDSVANGYVPQTDAVLAKTGLLNPEGEETITFTAPDEPGIYPYVCTFPGHAMIMYGALYVDVKYEQSEAFDLNLPEIVRMAELEKTKAKVAVERPTFMRAFMPNSGPAAIAVALPEELNVCWDAGNCRLRYAWSGGFIDPTRMFNSNGSALCEVLGKEFWTSTKGENLYGLQFGDDKPESVDFKGYNVVDGVPEYKYQVDGVAVREHISTAAKGALSWRFVIDSPTTDVRVLAPESTTSTISAAVGRRDGDHWIVPQKDASEFTLTITQK